MVKAFFSGHILQKFITLTNLLLLSKKESVKVFSDLRSRSLSNFVNKIISRLVHEKVSKVVPMIISPNQTTFVKRRSSITENV